MSTVYTESPFALATFAGLLHLRNGNRAAAAVFFALGACFRANGALNAGFLIWDAVRRVPAGGVGPLLVGVLGALLVFAPYVAVETYGYQQYCLTAEAPSWCHGAVPSMQCKAMPFVSRFVRELTAGAVNPCDQALRR